MDYDHPMESVLIGHPERALPFCVKHYRILDGSGQRVAEITDNHQARNLIRLTPAITTELLVIELLASHGQTPAALFEVRCYET